MRRVLKWKFETVGTEIPKVWTNVITKTSNHREIPSLAIERDVLLEEGYYSDCEYYFTYYTFGETSFLL